MLKRILQVQLPQEGSGDWNVVFDESSLDDPAKIRFQESLDLAAAASAKLNTTMLGASMVITRRARRTMAVKKKMKQTTEEQLERELSAATNIQKKVRARVDQLKFMQMTLQRQKSATLIQAQIRARRGAYLAQTERDRQVDAAVLIEKIARTRIANKQMDGLRQERNEERRGAAVVIQRSYHHQHEYRVQMGLADPGGGSQGLSASQVAQHENGHEIGPRNSIQMGMLQEEELSEAGSRSSRSSVTSSRSRTSNASFRSRGSRFSSARSSTSTFSARSYVSTNTGHGLSPLREIENRHRLHDLSSGSDSSSESESESDDDHSSGQKNQEQPFVEQDPYMERIQVLKSELKVNRDPDDQPTLSYDLKMKKRRKLSVDLHAMDAEKTREWEKFVDKQLVHHARELRKEEVAAGGTGTGTGT